MEAKANISPNTTVAHGDGPMYVEFEDGHRIELRAPKTLLSGVMVGERSFCQIETLSIKDPRNNLYAEIVFNPEKKGAIASFFGKKPTEERGDYFEGVISMNPQIDYKKNRSKLKQG